MLKIILPFAAALLLLAASTASAEEALPEACRAGGGQMNHKMADMADMDGLTDMQKAYVDGMGDMDSAMMSGIMAADPDVAFVCGMIPHHLGAIAMARVQLQYGKDAWVRDLAQKIIEAQTGEIADMRKWLDTHAK